MLKTVFREMIIILLLIVIIVLLLGILFYEYTPSSKTVPSKVQEYALEETIKTELDQELEKIGSEEIIKTYQLDAVDIEEYEKTNEYNKGKVNPFVEYSKGTNNTNTENDAIDNEQNNNTNTENSSIDNEKNDNNTNINQDPSKDNFLNTTGK